MKQERLNGKVNPDGETICGKFERLICSVCVCACGGREGREKREEAGEPEH